MAKFDVKEGALWGLMLLAAGGLLYVGFLQGEVKLGGEAPPLALRGEDGAVVDIQGDRGKVVVLNFYATWCPPCRAEIPDFARVWSAEEAKGDVRLYGVVFESGTPEESVAKSRQMGVNYPILQGNGPVAERYVLRSYPTTVIIDPHGHLVDRVEGTLSEGELRERIAAARAGHDH